MNKFFKIKTLTALMCASALGFAYAQETVESGHIAVENPADLSHAEANEIYDELSSRMADGYALAELPIIENYQTWTRYNSAPYLSATHGHRFVNNFANSKAIGYGELAKGETYPEGTVFAKDSLTVIDDHKFFAGAMFVMEKLAAGAHPETADWRYVMILPDGTTHGDTVGSKPRLVKYCHACHAAKASKDFVFFVPEDYQVE